jgi:hypothetical protein
MLQWDLWWGEAGQGERLRAVCSREGAAAGGGKSQHLDEQRPANSVDEGVKWARAVWRGRAALPLVQPSGFPVEAMSAGQQCATDIAHAPHPMSPRASHTPTFTASFST